MPANATSITRQDRLDSGRAATAVYRARQAEIFRQAFLIAVLVAVAAVAAPLRAQTPERERTGAPQATGALHTVRTIPEACTRIEGAFTGDPAQPYRMQAVNTVPNCQPRARFVDAAQAQPKADAGWILNEVIRVPDAACPSRQAVVKVWRKPVGQALERDGQGQVRIYLQDAQKQAAAGRIAQTPMFAAQMKLEGQACR